MRIQNDNSNVFRNYEEFVDATIDIARRLKQVRIVSSGISEDILIGHASHVKRGLKVSNVFKKLTDPRDAEKVLLRMSHPAHVSLEVLISNRRLENQQVLDYDGREFYVLNQYPDAVKSCNFYQDLIDTNVHYLQIETYQYTDHIKMYHDFLSYMYGVSSELYGGRNLLSFRYDESNTLAELGLSYNSLDYLRNSGIKYVSDLAKLPSDFDFSGLSDQSYRVISYLMSRMKSSDGSSHKGSKEDEIDDSVPEHDEAT